MTKRSFFLTLAAGLLASVAFATPSQAGTEYVLKAQFDLTPAGSTATDITVTLTGAVPLGMAPYTTTGGATASGAGDVITLTFAATGAGSYVTDFMGNSGLLISAITSPALSGVVPATGVTGTGLNVTISSVPEPSSMALLGIGMTGFLAFRRLFKRTSAA
jgi:hypothetical protein